MKISAYKPQSLDDNTSNILTAFLDNLPQEGKQNLIPFIATCRDNDILFTLSEHLKSAILVSCGFLGESPHPLRVRNTPDVTLSPLPDAEDRVNVVSSHRTQSSDRNSQTKLKQQCLKRDNYQCLATGVYDKKYAAGNVPDDWLKLTGVTELAHIIPHALGKFRNSVEEVQRARAWAAIYTCFPDIQSHTNCSAETVNDSENLMTLLAPVHTEFGNFEIAFEPTDEEHRYRLQFYHFSTFLHHYLPEPDENNERIVRFTKHANYKLPSRVLLSAHAAVARILPATGMART